MVHLIVSFSASSFQVHGKTSVAHRDTEFLSIHHSQILLATFLITENVLNSCPTTYGSRCDCHTDPPVSPKNMLWMPSSERMSVFQLLESGQGRCVINERSLQPGVNVTSVRQLISQKTSSIMRVSCRIIPQLNPGDVGLRSFNPSSSISTTTHLFDTVP